MTYNEFIQAILDTRGRFNVPEGEYKERHHIIPKCMGGTNDKANLIDLYAREHFIAHKLLAEENPDNYDLLLAWWCMSIVSNEDEQRYTLTPEEYEEVKIKFAAYISQTRQGENHPFYGKHHTEEAIEKISARSAGSNNPMYGKPCYYNMTETEVANWKNNLVLGSPRRKLVKCRETGVIYNSINSAVKALGVTKGQINKSMLYNIKVGEFSFIEVDKETGEEIIKLSEEDLIKRNEQNNLNQSIATAKWWAERKANGDSGSASSLKGKETMRKKYNTGSGYVAHKQIINKKGEK